MKYGAQFLAISTFATCLACILLFGSPVAGEELSRTTCDGLERDLVTEINRLRMHPESYIELLEERRSRYNGTRLTLTDLGHELTVVTKEGWPAVEEAIQALRTAGPGPALEVSEGVSLAARGHAREQAKLPHASHIGLDGSTFIERIGRHVPNTEAAGEDITVGGLPLATEIVQKSLIDDGTKSRPHRLTLLNKDFRLIGAACEPQEHFGFLCVLDFASQAGSPR
jgi:hypothetical protein